MTSLEIRYRRLLACYPSGYRREYEEELLGVLLADADPGRRRPSARDAADLLGGALRVHLRRLLGVGTSAHWREACAVAGMLLAALMLFEALPSLVYFGSGLTALPLPTPAYALSFLAPAATVLMAIGLWLGRRLMAAAAAWSAVAATVAGLVLQVPVGPGYSGAKYPFAVPVLATAVFLTLPSSPRRGAALIGRHRRAGLWLGVVAGVILAYAPWWEWSNPEGYRGWMLVLFAICGYAASVAVWSPVGRRAVLLLVVPFAGLIDAVDATSTLFSWDAAGWSELSMVAAALVMFCLTALRSRPPRLADDHPEPTQRD